MRITKGRILTALLAAVLLTGCGAAKEETTRATPPPTPTTATSAPSETWSPPSATPSTKAWGTTATWEGGLQVTVSAPTRWTPSEWAIDHTPGNRVRAFKVTLRNTGSEPFDTSLVDVKAAVGAEGVSAESVWDGDTGTGIEGTILPGSVRTATYLFDIPPKHLGKVQVEVTPSFDYKTIIYEGSAE